MNPRVNSFWVKLCELSVNNYLSWCESAKKSAEKIEKQSFLTNTRPLGEENSKQKTAQNYLDFTNQMLYNKSV